MSTRVTSRDPFSFVYLAQYTLPPFAQSVPCWGFFEATMTSRGELKKSSLEALMLHCVPRGVNSRPCIYIHHNIHNLMYVKGLGCSYAVGVVTEILASTVTSGSPIAPARIRVAFFQIGRVSRVESGSGNN